MVSGWVGVNSEFCYLVWFRHAKDANELFVINQMSSWQLLQRLWEEIRGLALAQGNFAAQCRLLIDLASSLLKPELCWTGGCAVTMKVGEAGMLAACLSLCLNPEVLWGGQEEKDAGDQGISHHNGESLYWNLASGHQTCLSVINVLNWWCMSTQC